MSNAVEEAERASELPDLTAKEGEDKVDDEILLQLSQLSQLRWDGVIDAEEFAEAKAKVLARQRTELLEKYKIEIDAAADKSAGGPKLAITCSDLVEDVVASGLLALGPVLDVMRNGAGAEQQAQGCAGIAILAGRDNCRPEVLKQKAVDAVVSAMESHLASAAVQYDGCAALSNCAVGEGEAAVRSAGGIARVIAAMATHLDDAKVQAKACLALANCAFSSDGEAQVLESGGVKAVLEALQAHPKSRATQDEGCDALCNLAGSEAGKQSISNLGGLALVEAAARVFPTSESVQDALKCLAARE